MLVFYMPIKLGAHHPNEGTSSVNLLIGMGQSRCLWHVTVKCPLSGTGAWVSLFPETLGANNDTRKTSTG